MTLKLTRRAVVAAGGLLCLARPGFAQTAHEVQMLNADPDNPRLRQVFVPRIQVIQPGDTVKFVATDRGHNSAVVDGMIPEGTEGWDGRISEEVEATLDRPGLYGYQCTPHASVGMVGLVVGEGEGMLDNLEAAQSVRQRGRARAIWDEIWEELAGMEFETA